MKILTVVGARPQFIKAAAVSREIAKHPEIKEVIIHTGQHFDKNMSDVFFEEMQIPAPDYRLDINSMNHGAMTGRMLEKIEELLLKEKPDYAMVYGDTNTTLAGALSAKKLHIKVVHVEAGLRSFNMQMPEEINRILTDQLSDILCCPTDHAVRNLQREGIGSYRGTIVNTGDVMQDVALFFGELAQEKSDIISRMGLTGTSFVLCTMHRAENTDALPRISSILDAINEISRDMPVVMPLHPRTAKIIAANGLKLNFTPVDPVSYFDMIELLKHAAIVLTDSGGLQKESFFFSKPCVTLRDETEWVELVENGFNVLAGADKTRILGCYEEMQKRRLDYNIDLYGNGHAGENIICAIQQQLNSWLS